MAAEPRFEIIPQGDVICIKARGKTRAGLFSSAVKGLFVAMRPQRNDEEAQKSERPFAVKADSTESLLFKLLNEAIIVSTVHQETCEEIKLDLITDTNAEGQFVGCALTDFNQQIVGVSDQRLDVKKDEETGEWEATICFST